MMQPAPTDRSGPSASAMQPALFIAHGSPMLAIEENPYTRFLGQLGASLQPRAILLFSAHWESRLQLVSDVAEYRTIHDFGGFPAPLYQIHYPARGDAELAAQAAALLAAAGIPSQAEPVRGLDHGAWVVLRLLYPEAQVPVVALSVNPALSPADQYRIGATLLPLRADGVLIIASGGTVHNLAALRWQDEEGEPEPWAVAFDDWVAARLGSWDLPALFNYESLAPQAVRAVPPRGNEHFIPLFCAMGAADDQRTARALHRSYRFGSLSHAVWQFGG